MPELEVGPERITNEWLGSVHSRRSRTTRELLDRKGLCVRISPLGRIQFLARYRIRRFARELMLGVFPEMRIEQARSELEAIREEIRQGKDPELTRQFRCPYRRHVETVEDLFWEVFDDYEINFLSGEPNAIAHFEQFVFPTLGKRHPGKVTKEEWLAVLAEAYRVDVKAARTLISELACAHSLAGELGIDPQPVLSTWYRDISDELYEYLDERGGITATL